MANVWLAFQSYANWLFTALGLRRSRRYFGVVYDSVTKQPVDPAVVKLVHADGSGTVETCVTDIRGRYGFVTFPGTYKLLVRSSSYRFPTDRITGESDGLYDRLYRGEFFTVTGESDVVAFNIPLDPTGKNWNQQAKRAVASSSPYLDYLLYRLLRLLFWFGLLYAGYVFWSERSNAALLVLSSYAIVIALPVLVPQPRLWGQLKSHDQSNLEGYQLELSSAAAPDLKLASAKTSQDGKFYLRAPSGRYRLRIRDASGGFVADVPAVARGECVINREVWLPHRAL